MMGYTNGFASAEGNGVGPSNYFLAPQPPSTSSAPRGPEGGVAADIRKTFHTFVYDYFLRTSMPDVALAILRAGAAVEFEDGGVNGEGGYGPGAFARGGSGKGSSGSGSTTTSEGGKVTDSKTDGFNYDRAFGLGSDYHPLRITAGNGEGASGLPSAASTTSSPERSSPHQKHSSALPPFPGGSQGLGFPRADSSSSEAIKALPKPKVPLDAPDGLLYEWWCVFWDVYSARPGQARSVGRVQPTLAAEAYLRQQRQQQSSAPQQHGMFSQSRREGFAELGTDGKPLRSFPPGGPQVPGGIPMQQSPPPQQMPQMPQPPQQRWVAQQHQINLMHQEALKSREMSARQTDPQQAQIEHQRAVHLQAQVHYAQMQLQRQQELERQRFQQGRIGGMSADPAGGPAPASIGPFGQIGPTGTAGGLATPHFAAAAAARRVPPLQHQSSNFARTPSGGGGMYGIGASPSIVERQMSLNNPATHMPHMTDPNASAGLMGLPIAVPQRVVSRPASRAQEYSAPGATALQRRSSQVSFHGSPAPTQIAAPMLQAGALRKEPPGADEGETPAPTTGRGRGKKPRLGGKAGDTNKSSPTMDEPGTGKKGRRKNAAIEPGTPVPMTGSDLVLSPAPIEAPTPLGGGGSGPHSHVASNNHALPQGLDPKTFRFNNPGALARQVTSAAAPQHGTLAETGNSGGLQRSSSGGSMLTVEGSMPPPSRSASGIYPPPNFQPEGPQSTSTSPMPPPQSSHSPALRPSSSAGNLPSSQEKASPRPPTGTSGGGGKEGEMPPPSPGATRSLQQNKASPNISSSGAASGTSTAAMSAPVPATASVAEPEDIRVDPVDDLTRFLKWNDDVTSASPVTESKSAPAPPKGILARLNTTTPSTPSGGMEGDISVPQNNIVDFDIFSGDDGGFNLHNENWDQFLNL